jgi:large subunit ribosomal protein L13
LSSVDRRRAAPGERRPGFRGNDRDAMKTYSVKKGEIERTWYVVDARDQVLGRLATRVARVLRGKHKPIYSPHLDVGDYVIVVNARDVRLTGKKADTKRYFRHSGFMGGEKLVPFKRMLRRKPEWVIERAVKGMLPKNTLGRQMAKKLRVYAGPDHPHEAQLPEPFEF